MVLPEPKENKLVFSIWPRHPYHPKFEKYVCKFLKQYPTILLSIFAKLAYQPGSLKICVVGISVTFFSGSKHGVQIKLSHLHSFKRDFARTFDVPKVSTISSLNFSPSSRL